MIAELMIFKEAKRIHFVGIGGIGMSGLARWCQAMGHVVSGSDSTVSDITQALQSEGIDVHIGHDGALVENVDLVIYTEAVHEDNVERVCAAELEKRCITYFEALGEATQGKRLIAISGTHGKTTTTAMLGLILIEAGLSPTVLVGSNLKEFDGRNVSVGEGDIVVLEACEYRDNFRFLEPWLLVVLNMDLDHTDFFTSLEDYESAFKRLAKKSESVIWPGETSSYDGPLGVPGDHNKSNAGVAQECARRLGVSDEVIAHALNKFSGTWRRFENRGVWQGVQIYDDYAHHPKEILATLSSAREVHPDSRIVICFEPHQYSRTKAFFEEFAAALSEADLFIIPGIYECRDRDSDKSVSPQLLAEAVQGLDTPAFAADDFEGGLEILKRELKEGDVLLMLGAGNIPQLTDMLLDS